jgi:hypothetical protein
MKFKDLKPGDVFTVNKRSCIYEHDQMRQETNGAVTLFVIFSKKKFQKISLAGVPPKFHALIQQRLRFEPEDSVFTVIESITEKKKTVLHALHDRHNCFVTFYGISTVKKLC